MGFDWRGLWIYGWTVDASGGGGDEGRGQAAISPGELAGKL